LNRKHCAFAAIFTKALYVKYIPAVTVVLNSKGIPNVPSIMVKTVVMPRAIIIPARMRNVGTTVMTATGIHIGANVVATTNETNLRSWFICLLSIVSPDDQH
jgi:hypothetical protein